MHSKSNLYQGSVSYCTETRTSLYEDGDICNLLRLQHHRSCPSTEGFQSAKHDSLPSSSCSPKCPLQCCWGDGEQHLGKRMELHYNHINHVCQCSMGLKPTNPWTCYLVSRKSWADLDEPLVFCTVFQEQKQGDPISHLCPPHSNSLQTLWLVTVPCLKWFPRNWKGSQKQRVIQGNEALCTLNVNGSAHFLFSIRFTT